MYYACETNAERNSITTNIFKNYINMTHPKDIDNIDLRSVPKNTLMIEFAIFSKNNERCSSSFDAKIYGNCGDADVLTD